MESGVWNNGRSNHRNKAVLQENLDKKKTRLLMLNTVSKCSPVKTCMSFKITLTEQLNLWLYIRSSLFWESVTWGNTLGEVDSFNWPVTDGQNTATELPTISPSKRLLLWGALLNLGVLGAGLSPRYFARPAEITRPLFNRKEDVSL